VVTFVTAVGGTSLDTFVESCTISGSSAHCLVGNTATLTGSNDQAATPIVVQIAATPTPTGASAGGSSRSSSGSGSSRTPSPTGGNNSGATSVTIASHAVVLAAFGAALALF